MNKNPKILMLVAAIFLTAILSFFVLGKGEKVSQNAHPIKKESVYDLESADTNNETMRTLIAHQQQIEREYKTVLEENAQLKKNKQAEDARQLAQQKEVLHQQFVDEKEKMQEEIRLSMKAHQAMDPNKQYPVDGANNLQNKGHQMIGDVTDLSQPLLETDPLHPTPQVVNDPNAKPVLPPSFSDEDRDAENEKEEHFYTIPANATLARTTLMTNIIGEVPVAGKLIEPAMPFKAIIGREDLLASNGLTLPADLGGIVVSGYSVGNMSLSCARMYVTQLLFTFQDGTFTVYPKENKLNGNEIYPKDALGYLSDRYGNVCLTGEYITDAPKVLASLAAFGGLNGFGQYASQAQTTTYTNADGSTTQMTGDALKYGMGNATSTGSDMAMRWYTQRVHDIFDAVYIPKMDGNVLKRFVFNATQTIPIDISSDARKIYFDHTEKPPINAPLD